MTTIEDLPAELLVEIFSHYINTEGHAKFSRNAAPVCKDWWNLSSMPSLWKSIRVSSWNDLVSLSKTKLLCHTQVLQVFGKSVDDNAIEILLEHNHLMAALPHIRQLKSLEIKYKSIHADTMKVVAKYCPNLEHLRMAAVKYGEDDEPMTLEELCPILETCGPKLKHLDFACCNIDDAVQIIEEIVDKCASLEILAWNTGCYAFPVHKVASGCPRLRKLELISCEFDDIDWNNFSGFKDLTKFKAVLCNFEDFDVCSLLKNSSKLDSLHLHFNFGMSLRNVSQISSNKVRFLNLSFELEEGIDLKAVELAMDKWTHSLLQLEINGCRYNITKAFKKFLDSNQCVKLQLLQVGTNNISIRVCSRSFNGNVNI